eukprot:CAMPEP_0201580606 /NCGR_PEP_ID=MMETSP0190_2-20130828/51543_1 /ASSEMBLY_ACC=CAM_ASM_000263 /TAXON_ID=37353 /ORGANISM="Rosalina sp." /LENGTH=147 /DNA_ID=CAMNT_0048017021 /DNA_START=122 /DNA_END=562 /DNA_ORIENTATION=-
MAEQKQQDVVGGGLSRKVFILRNKVNKFTKTLAIDNDGKVRTTLNLKANGWEGLTIQQSTKAGVYFISSSKDPKKVLAVKGNGDVTTTPNRVVDGWEGFKFEPAGDFKYFIVSNNPKAKSPTVLAIDDDGKVTTTNNKVKDGWEGLL